MQNVTIGKNTSPGDDPIMQSIRPMAQALPQSGIIEVVNYGREKPDLVPLWVGEGDLATPDFISAAAFKALHEGHTFYTYQRGIPQLRQALADYTNRHFQTTVEAERMIVTASGMQGIVETMQALVGPGDEVAVVAPVWPNIFAAIHLQDAVSKPVTLDFDNGVWRLDLDKLFAACGPKTKALFINTPGNPSGWVMEEADMLRVRDFVRERGLWLVADEVYAQFVYDLPRATSFLEIMEPEERLIVSNTFSKNWAMSGWRVGWLTIPKALGQVFENLVQYNTSGVATFLQYGCAAALNDGDDFVHALVQRCHRGRDILCSALESLPNVYLSRPNGSFYLFFKVAGEEDSTAFTKRMVDVANVGLAPGIAFGPGGEGYVRACFASSHDKLQIAVERLVNALS